MADELGGPVGACPAVARCRENSSLTSAGKQTKFVLLGLLREWPSHDFCSHASQVTAGLRTLCSGFASLGLPRFSRPLASFITLYLLSTLTFCSRSTGGFSSRRIALDSRGFHVFPGLRFAGFR